MKWDHFLGPDENFNRTAQEGIPWHGTDCGSAIGAIVNDKQAAAGSALFTSKEHLPESSIPQIVTIAAAMPRQEVTISLLAATIEQSINNGADIVSASYSSWCGLYCMLFQRDAPLLNVLTYAQERRVAVLLGGGNTSTAVPNHPTMPFEYLVGCQWDGLGLCIGGVGMIGQRWVRSNWGDSLVTSGPADALLVSALVDRDDDGDGIPEHMPPTALRAFDGTSAATAFTAGVIAFAESVWGQRFGNGELRAMLKNSNRKTSDGGDPILDASAFLRQKLVLGTDLDEPNNTLLDVKGRPARLPDPAETYKLTTDSDTDLFPMVFSSCMTATAEMHYVADWEAEAVPSALSLSIIDELGTTVATGKRETPGTFKLTSSKLNANERHYLKVSNEVPAGSPKALPTAYDLNVTTSACAN
jgi:hypothetical protein